MFNQGQQKAKSKFQLFLNMTFLNENIKTVNFKARKEIFTIFKVDQAQINFEYNVIWRFIKDSYCHIVHTKEKYQFQLITL